MSNFNKTLLCIGSSLFGLFSMFYFVYILIFEPAYPWLSFGLSIASLFLYVFSSLYIRYYFTRCCALCLRDMASDEKRFVSKNGAGEIVAVCCEECFKKKRSDDKTFNEEDEREK